MNHFTEVKTDLLKLSLPIGLIIVTVYPSYNIVFANQRFCELLGFEDEADLLRSTRKSGWDYVYPEDMERLQIEAFQHSNSPDPYSIAYRAVKKDGSLVWVNQGSQHVVDEGGHELVFAYYTDISAQKQMEETIRAGTQKYQTLVNSIPGGVGMYHLDEAFTPIFLSERVYELCGMTKEEYLALTHHSTLDILHPDDRKGFVEAVRTAKRENKKFDYTHRTLQKNGSYRWMQVSGQVMATQGNVPALYAVITDVHEQFKSEQALRESELRYSTAVKASNINIWEYEYATDSLTVFSRSPRISLNGSAPTSRILSVIDGRHIREDCVSTLLDVIQRMKNGEKEVVVDLWLRLQADSDCWCERVTCTNLFDDNGCPVRAYCVGHDVTKEKAAEKRYRDELSYREAMQKATMASINVNLTQNVFLDYRSNFPELTAHMSTAKTAQDYFNQVYVQLTTKEQRTQCAAVFSRDALLRHFANGETTLSLELTRKIGDRQYWTVLNAYMMRQPDTQDIVAFLYSTNITSERTMQNVMSAIVKTDYDFLVVVDARRDTATRYSENDFDNKYASESNHFEEETREYVRRYVCPADSVRVMAELTLPNILAQLSAHGTYSIFYSMLDPHGKMLKKQLRFNYIDNKTNSFLMTRIDITDAFLEQEKKNQELVAAMEMAQRANAAKSEFLSRVSHEIRTPMNAIMGMAQIALQNLDDKAFVRECIEKSQYSSQFLLLLLNDILDMSKIESGKVVLKNEVIPCQRFLDSINTIIGAQAQAKGVAYTVTEFEGRRTSYLGDGVRLQQILINILSNAVKFTPTGGTVRLDVSQLSGDENGVVLCFQVSDTGVGIGPDFLPNLFKPFSQEHTGATTSYGGTGLGLAISKNLAQLMGGDISVDSTLGQGTTFQVLVPFGVTSDTSQAFTPSSVLSSHQAYDFTGKKILLVEDHQLNIMVAKKLLEFKNATVVVAENGQKGLQLFAEAPEQTYDLVLMDIRMPVMDGLEAAQRIRALDKTVPIIAMSANAFDEDVVKSKKAGMNAHLGKPIDAQLLYKTMSEFLPPK